MDPFFIKVQDTDGELINLSDSFRPRLDDTIETVKNKIYAGTAGEDADDIVFWPAFQKLTVQDSNGKTVLLDPSSKFRDTFVPSGRAKTVLAEATQSGFFKDNTITIEDLTEVLDEDEPPKPNTDTFRQQLAVLKEDYPNLTSRDLVMAYKLSNEEDDSEVQKFITAAQKAKSLVQKKFEKEASNFLNIPKNLVPDTTVDRIVKRDKSGKYAFSLLQALIDFKSPVVQRLAENKKVEQREFLNLKVLFNQLTLSDFLPFISVASEPKQPPFIKVLDKLRSDSMSRSMVEKWILVDRPGVSSTLKQPKGLTVRIRDRQNYQLINIFSDGRMSIRCSWSESENAGPKELEHCVKQADKFVEQVNKIRVAFEGQERIPKLKLENATIRNLDGQMHIQANLDKQKLKSLAQQRSYIKFFAGTLREPKLKKQLCKDLGISEEKCGPKIKVSQLKSQARDKGIPLFTELAQKDQITLQYKRVSQRTAKPRIVAGQLIVDEEDTPLKVLITIRTSTKFDNTTSVSIKNARSFQQLNLLFDFTISLLKLVEGNALQKVTQTVKVIPKTKKKSKLQALKDIGIPVDSKSCQKPRQLEIDNAVPPAIPVIEGSYPLIINGNRLVCTNPKAPYPGYTSQGVPCCFPKDQRKSKKFKQFHNPDEFKKQISSEDLEIKRENIITTDKLLLPGRIGVLPDQIKKYFGRFNADFFRVGVFQDQDSFLNAVFAATKDASGLGSVAELKKNLVEWMNKISRNRFQSLQNGEIAREFSRKDYIQLIEDGGGDHMQLIGIVSRYLRRNIFILSEAKQNIVCYSDYKQLKDYVQKGVPTIFLLKKGPNYEPIFIVPQQGKPKSEFGSKNEIVTITKSLYTFSCERTPLQASRFKSAENAKFSLKNLNEANIEIKHQLVNAYNKTVYLVTDDNTLIPVKPSGPISKLKIKDLSSNLPKNNAEKLIKRYTIIANKSKLNLKVKAQVLEKGEVVGLVLENGYVVPTQKGQRILRLPISKLNFSVDLDKFLESGLTIKDDRVKLAAQIKYNNGLLQQVRFEYASKLAAAERERLRKIVTDATTSQTEKQKRLRPLVKKELEELSIESVIKPNELNSFRSSGKCSIIKQEDACARNPYCAYSKAKKECRIGIPEGKIKGILDSIILELIRDNVRQRILRNRVTLESSRADEFVQRPGETILFDLKSAKNWLKN